MYPGALVVAGPRLAVTAAGGPVATGAAVAGVPAVAGVAAVAAGAVAGAGVPVVVAVPAVVPVAAALTLCRGWGDKVRVSLVPAEVANLAVAHGWCVVGW